MDKPTFMLWCLLGLGISLIALLAVGRARRALVPRYCWWLLLTSGGVICMYGLSHSTNPSYAHRVSVVGQASPLTERRVGRESKFVFTFAPESGTPLALETHLILPHWSSEEAFQSRVLSITYLDDAARSVSNEAVDITILSGRDAGWHDSLDARPFGVWLGIPVGAMIAGLGYLGLQYRKQDLGAKTEIAAHPGRLL